MWEVILKLLDKLFIYGLWEGIKSYTPVIILSAGVYQISDWIAASFFGIGLFSLIHLLKSWFDFYKCIENDKKKIEGKIISFREEPPILYIQDEEIYISVVAVFYNCSSQIVSCVIDTTKTEIIVNNNTKPKDEYIYHNTSWLNPPNSPLVTITDHIILSLKDVTADLDIKIDAKIYLKYGVKNEENYELYQEIKSHYKVTFNGEKKSIKSVELIRNKPIK